MSGLTSWYAQKYLKKVKAQLKDTDELEYIVPSVRYDKSIQYVYEDTITGKRFCCNLPEDVE